MIINPKVAIEQGWIKNVPEHCIQPNAIDFVIDDVYQINTTCPFTLFEDEQGKAAKKEMRPCDKVSLTKFSLSDDTNFFGWHLQEGVYDIMSNMHVNIPEGVAARLIIRSTFNRNGCLLSAGLYDQGFSGSIGAALHVSGNIRINQGVRVGQIIFEQAENSGILYAGGYNTKPGQHWTDKGV